MKRDQFTFYRSYYEAVKQLPARERKIAGELFLAICAYALDGEEPRLSGLPLTLFTLIRPTLDSGMKQAQKRRQTDGLNASPTESKHHFVPITDRNKAQAESALDAISEGNSEPGKAALDAIGEGNPVPFADGNEREGEKEREIEGEHECDKGAKPPKPPAAPRRFTPPAVQEVAAYCRERNNGVDAQRFVDFYTAKGWRVGKTPMKDWRACVRTWERQDATQPGKEACVDPYDSYDRL